jgi:hypothetical protein
MRRIARLLPYLGILLLLLVAVAVLLRAGPLSEHARNLIAAQVSQQLERDVTVGDASVSLSGSVVLRDVIVRNPDGSVLLRAPEVDARVGRPGSWLPLLSAPTEVREVRLIAPEATLRRDASGRLSIADILERKPERPSRFQGDVTVEGGRLLFVDDVRGTTTTVEGVNLTVRYSAPGKAKFELRAPANEGGFERLRLSGETDGETGVTRLKGSAERLDLGYAMARAPETGAVDVRTGRADLSWEVTLDPKGQSGLSYVVDADVADATVAFPWLRRPVQGVNGRLRLQDGDLHLDGLAGTVADAPVTARGVIGELGDPQLDLDIAISGIRYPQVRALFPSLAFPAGLSLPSPMRILAQVEGPAADVRVTGEATVRVIKFRTVPWNDVVGRFEYSRGRLKVKGLHAHGSPPELAAEFEIDLGKGRPAAEGEGMLLNVPLSVLAQMAGVDGIGLEGTARLSIRGRLGDDTSVEGDFAASAVGIRGVRLGEVAGEFEFSDGRLRLRRCAIDGPMGVGTLEAELSEDGDYTLGAAFSALDLSSLGPAISLRGLRGTCCAQMQMSGRLDADQVSGRLELGPGEVQQRAFERLIADFAISAERVEIRDLRILLGEGRYVGELQVVEWRGDPRAAQLSGRLQVMGATPGDLLSPQYLAVVPAGTIDGAAEIGGTLADPEVAVDLRMESMAVAGRSFESGRVRLRYDGQRLVIQEVFLADAGTRVVASGQYVPGPGLSIALVADPVDLAALAPEVRRRYGLALAGQMRVRAQATGPWRGPRVAFAVKAESFEVNEIVFDELSISGEWAPGRLRIGSALLQRGESKISLTGTISDLAGTLDLTLALDRFQLRDAQIIAHGAIYRLQRAGVRSPYFDSYWKIPTPLTGELTATLHAGGLIQSPELAISLALARFAFNGREIEHIGGDLTLKTAWRGQRRLTLDSAEVSLEVSHEQATARITGNASLEGDSYLVADVSNLDLRMLGPWLGYPAGLGGQATINFDITGPILAPVLRGDVFVDNLSVGGLSLEAATASPIQLQQEGLHAGVLTLEQIRLRNGPMEAIGSASVPVFAPDEGQEDRMAKAELHLADASFAPLEGMVPAEFDAHVYLLGNEVLLTQDASDPQSAPGIRGTLGSGWFEVGGKVILRGLAPAEWDRNSFDVRASFHAAEVAIPGITEATLDGALWLTNEKDRAVLRTPEGDPLVVSDAWVGLPETSSMPRAAALPFAPKVEVTVLVGRNVKFRYGAPARPTEVDIEPARLDPPEEATGYLRLTGELSPQALDVDARFDTHSGRIVFPNGVLTLRRGTARMVRESGQFRVTVSGEAHGRVGDYSVTLSPAGQIYPFDEERFALNAASIPYLEEAYVMALLVGPVVAPSRGGRQDVAALLAEPGRSTGGGGEITGIMIPPFGSTLGMHEVALDVALEGQVRLRIGERYRRFVVSYVSALSGPVESRTLRINYEITPLWSLGWSVDELDRGRWEAQAFIPF